ncbi:Outer membrane receptor proteins, mostly Fe transport [Variovorax sp. HW608]|uniref:TonB-dependent receptor n=1 Tax=Variovorax sp. HW608 TaxID=1034889 RepID=UPI00082021D3|nr:TonB-dependent receptor [Variovorax sp. HW608]SCK11653.1 Outer membrane receptor proteins, mostly Fe transport [Variovorax sp. HW608]
MRRRVRFPAFTLAPLAASALLLGQSTPAVAEEEDPDAPAELSTVVVVAPTPLPGLDVPRDHVPSNVQTATDADLERLHSPDLTNYLSRAVGGVTINETQGNPFQPDVNYRGFTASPLPGTPQGLSVYMDGVRLNQPFGDVVSWDLIPRSAISTVALMPGSNPLFGLNTLGGALVIQTKDGLHNPGTSVQVMGGSWGRAAAEFETGGSDKDSGWNWFVSGNRFHEKGWRVDSPSDVRQLFAKVGHVTRDGSISLTTAFADNDLTGNGTQELGALQRDWASVRTIPDNTRNKSAFVNLALTQALDDTWTLSGNTYYRNIRTSTFNGDVNDAALSESVYQPTAAERAALAAAGFTGNPASGANASNTPFPKWRCIANALLNTEPNEKCNGLINRTETRQQNYGLAGQLSAEAKTGSLEHLFVMGAAYDASRVRFGQSTQFGYINPDRTVTPVFGPGAFADGTQDSENAFDARVRLSSRSSTGSVYATDTIALDARTHLTLSGRYNRTSVHNTDELKPGGGPGSLDGHSTFSRFNPAVGLTFAPSQALTLYAGVNQGSRAPTAIELGCADPSTPCKLPNSFAGDPPLKQVVTTTFEAGLRGVIQPDVAWNLGVFRSDNRDDLLFVADNSSGFGYFKNFGKTRRQGVEMGLSAKPARGLTLGGNFMLLDATYRSAETIGGSGNSSNDQALAGFPGTDGNIRIRPGDRIPGLPPQVLKLYADYEPNAQWRIGLDMLASSGANLRGNENGLHVPDGVYYTGPGRSAGYAVFNLGVDYKPRADLKFFVQIANLFNARYTTGGQLGANGFTAGGAYIARGLPQNANGDYPVSRASLMSPGAPRAAWVGLRYTFGG